MMPDARSVVHLLPELDHGGVEDHVVALANAQSAAGMSVCVVSGGGRLASSLSSGVEHIALPVGKKNIFTGMSCARRIARLARERGAQILHAHSRVPAWAAYFAKKFCPQLKIVYTAHAMFSKNLGTWPIGRADAVICVSRSVRDDLEYRVSRVPTVRVIYNALTKEIVPWRGSGGDVRRMICVGRLTRLKNIQTVISALAQIKDEAWTLDICGDGPMREELETLSRELKISERIRYQGAVNDVPMRIAESDLFLFPSLHEGLGLSLLEALAAGVPTLASDTQAARETTCGGSLLPADDVGAWSAAIGAYLAGEPPRTRMAIHLPTTDEHASAVREVYEEVLGREVV